jgi:Copper amine oxidase N-terminal domain
LLLCGTVLWSVSTTAPVEAQTPATTSSAAAPVAATPATQAATSPPVSASTTAGTAQNLPITINIDGHTVDASPAPLLRDGTVLVPLRGALEQLGARVNYVAEDQRIDIIQAGRQVSLRVGQNSAIVVGQTVPLATPPQLFENRAFVPLRALAELFGYRVQWIEGSRTVAIYSDAGGSQVSIDHRTALRQGGPLGVQINFHDAALNEVEALLDAARKAGAGIIKVRFDWNNLEPVKGQDFQWPIYDRVVREARQRGLIVTGVLGNSTQWASVFSRSSNPAEWRNGAPRDSELPAWQNYVRRTVGRYRNDVHAWQVWEKPSSDNFRSGRRVYYNLVTLAATAARQSDPKAIVYVGEPGGINLDYMEGLDQSGTAALLDGVALYPVSQYQPGALAAPESFLRPFAALREHLTATGDAHGRDYWIGGLSRPVLVEVQSQTGVPGAMVAKATDAVSGTAWGTSASVRLASGGEPGGNNNNGEQVTSGAGVEARTAIITSDEATRQRLLHTFTATAQADYLMRAATLALAAGSDKVFWGSLRDNAAYERVEPIDPEYNSGLLRRDFTPRPSYLAFQVLAQQVRGKKYIGPLALGPHAVALMFDDGRHGSVAAWAVTGTAPLVLNTTGQDPQSPNSVYIAASPDTQVLDAAGTVLGGPAGTFQLSDSPVWITNVAQETRSAARAGQDEKGLVRLSPFPPEFTPDEGATVTFGKEGSEKGLYWRKYSNFRGMANKIVRIEGRSGLSTETSLDIYNPAAGRPFIFLDVADDYLYLTRGVPVTVTVEVKRPAPPTSQLITTTAGFNIQYDTPTGGKYTPWQVVEPGEGWATYTFEIPNASFANIGGSDLVINTFGSKQNLVFGSVAVRRAGKQPENPL